MEMCWRRLWEKKKLRRRETRNDASEEPRNPLWTRIYRLLRCTMIGVISGNRS